MLFKPSSLWYFVIAAQANTNILSFMFNYVVNFTSATYLCGFNLLSNDLSFLPKGFFSISCKAGRSASDKFVLFLCVNILISFIFEE